ncbi:MAG: isocitrate/isopropylmalate dehydrogenase family protein [Deltaproteobacteria bacterium]|nr:isocitrate/isopropylmalate dehydrogenase family protein [Deltaproteobacteria bacterium]
MSHKIAVIPGDGIGPEVITEGAKLLESLDFKLTYFDWGAEKFLQEGIGLPQDALEMLEKNFDAIYFGALGDPRIPDMAHGREILLGLRTGLDLYVNFRPIMLLHPTLGVLSKNQGIDFVVFRENTQDCYLGRGETKHAGTQKEVTIDESMHSYAGVERIIKQAFEHAQNTGRKSVHLGHKANAIKFGGPLWLRVFREVAKSYPDIQAKEQHIDLMALEFVRAPEQFEVIVTSNLFGDILTDLGAGLVGGLGLAASGNWHPGKIGLFEPVHGSAPDIAGQNKANPMAAFLSAALLLDFLGQKEPAQATQNAVKQAITQGICTPDLGGQKTTQEVGSFIRNQIL